MSEPPVELGSQAHSASGDDVLMPIRLVRRLLSRLSLPIEIILLIIDFADYHPALRAERKDRMHVTAGLGFANYAQLYLLSPPLPSHCCSTTITSSSSTLELEGQNWSAKKVRWRVEGHDQGWTPSGSSDALIGRFHPTYSWYDACILRRRAHSTSNLASKSESDLAGVPGLYRTLDDPEKLDGLLEPLGGWRLVKNGASSVWRVQSNRIAQLDLEQYEIVWAAEPTRAGEEMQSVKACGAWAGEGFVKALRPGDRVGLWMRAMFPGWANYIREASFEILCEVR